MLAMEKRVKMLEDLLLNFAGMVVGEPGELQRVARTIETRASREFEEDNKVLSPERRSKAMQRIGRHFRTDERVQHTQVMKSVQGMISSDEFHFLMADLARKGEIKIIKEVPERGKPTTYYQAIRTQPS